MRLTLTNEEIQKAKEEYFKAGGKVTKIDKEDLEKAEIKLIGPMRHNQKTWKGSGFKTFYK